MGKKKKVNVVVRTISMNIEKNDKVYSVIDELCFKGKNIYNSLLFLMRQYYIINKKIKNNKELTEFEKETMNDINKDIERVNNYFKEKGKDNIFTPINGECLHLGSNMYIPYLLKEKECCKDIGNSDIFEKTVAKAISTWESYKSLNEDYYKNPSKYKARPQMPKYKDKEKGRFSLVVYAARQCKIENGILEITCKALKDKNIRFKVPFETYKNKGKDNTVKLQTLEFTKRSGCYKVLITYDIPKVDKLESKNRIAAIDLGISRLATVCNNVGVEPFMINGNPLKSINEHAYIQKAKAQRILMKVNGKYHSRKIDKINLDRDNKIKHYMHLSSTYIIRWCLKNKIDTLIVGKNDNWKQNLKKDKKLGTSKVRRGFVQIPFNNFISQLEYKCENFGINFILTEEGYTSKTSFLDGEDSYKESWNGAKRRKERGMYISDNGTIIHADLNGAYQIARKINKDYFKECKIHLQPRLITINNEILKDVV